MVFCSTGRYKYWYVYFRNFTLPVDYAIMPGTVVQVQGITVVEQPVECGI
jgi:hypothetical protein